ncbi:MAG TPA: spore germination protein GerW family protein [Actinomycetota bacterium]|jgi:uncharacterized spore protein YtfJ
MDVQEVVSQARDAISVKRVFGDPIEKDGVTVIPAAKVGGGAGGGGGEGQDQDGVGGKGSGTGFGLSARPAGAYVIKDGTVTWRPAVDVNRVIMGAQILAATALLTIRAIVKARSKARAAQA